MEAKNKFDTLLSGEHRWANQWEKLWTSQRTISCNWQANIHFLNVAKIVDFGGGGYLMLFVRVKKWRLQTSNKAHWLPTTKNICLLHETLRQVWLMNLIWLTIISSFTYVLDKLEKTDLKQKVETSTLITIHSEGNVMCTHFSSNPPNSCWDLKKQLKSQPHGGARGEVSGLCVARECPSVQHVLPIKVITIYCLSTLNIYQM